MHRPVLRNSNSDHTSCDRLDPQGCLIGPSPTTGSVAHALVLETLVTALVDVPHGSLGVTAGHGARPL